MFWIIVVVAVVLDFVSKQAVIGGMELGQCITVIPHVLDLNYIQNHGAAFSILQGKTVFLIVATVIMMGALCVYAIKMKDRIPKMELISLAMIVGGGIGNLIDRIALGYVTDFLDIHIIPIFNVADCFVTVGCFLLVFSVLILEPKKEKKQETE